MESSPLKLKQQKKSDTLLSFDKCLICQKKLPDNHQFILNPTRQGEECLIEAIKLRKDDLFNQLDEHFDGKPENLVESNVIWHKNCSSSYTSKTNLSHVESHVESLLMKRRGEKLATCLASLHLLVKRQAFVLKLLLWTGICVYFASRKSIMVKRTYVKFLPCRASKT